MKRTIVERRQMNKRKKTNKMDSIKKLQHKSVSNVFDDHIVFIFDMDDKLRKVGIPEMYFCKYIKDALK